MDKLLFISIDLALKANRIPWLWELWEKLKEGVGDG